MAANDIALMGAVYPDVPQVVLPVDGGGTATFTDVSDTTATASDVLNSKYFYNASGQKVQGTATGGGTAAISVVDTADPAGGVVRTITALDISDTTAVAADVASGKYFYAADGTKTAGTGSGGVDCPEFTITMDQNYDITGITCNKTFSQCWGYVNNDQYNALIHSPVMGEQYGVACNGTSTTLVYSIYPSQSGVSSVLITIHSDESITWEEPVTTSRSSSDLTESNLTVTAPSGYYPSSASKTLSDQNLTAENIKKDVSIFGVTGSYDGSSSGSVIQVYEGWDYKTSTTLSATNVSLTIAEAGTYRISWMGFRNNSQATFGTQLYKNDTAYGTEITTFTRTYGVRVSIAGVQLAKNDVITVYARSRSSSYYMYVGQLMAVKTG